MEILLGLIVSVFEKIGLSWLIKRKQTEKAQEVADAPLTDKEEADGLLK